MEGRKEIVEICLVSKHCSYWLEKAQYKWQKQLSGGLKVKYYCQYFEGKRIKHEKNSYSLQLLRLKRTGNIFTSSGLNGCWRQIFVNLIFVKKLILKMPLSVCSAGESSRVGHTSTSTFCFVPRAVCRPCQTPLLFICSLLLLRSSFRWSTPFLFSWCAFRNESLEIQF